MINKMGELYMKKSFDEFYFTQTNQIHELDEINDYVDKNDGSYAYYQDKIKCPECRQAELSYTHKTTRKRAYLSKKPSSHHTTKCSYNYSYATNKEVTTYFESLSANQIEDKLSAMINMLCKDNHLHEVVGSNLNIGQNPMLFDVKDEQNSRERKVLRRKKLVGYIDKSFGEDLHIFYGQVKLVCKENEKQNNHFGSSFKYYILTLKTLNRNNEWRFRAKVYRGNIKDEINENSIYNIALIGKCDFSHEYLEIKLLNKNALKYKAIKEG